MNRSVTLALIAMIAAILSARADTQSASNTAAPLVRMQCSEPFSSNTGWSLNVNLDGSARLTMDTHPQPTIRTFKVSAINLDIFHHAVDEQRFFELSSEYGSHVPDSGKRTILVNVGKKRRTVTLLFLNSSAPNISEVKRALLVWKIARNWFSDAGATDMRAYDRKILDAPNSSSHATTGR